jgi:hypothetical protein
VALNRRSGFAASSAGGAARAAREQPRGQVERDAVDEVAQQQPQPRVAVRDQRQRRQEVLAELAVRRPRLRRLGNLEAQ